MSATQQHDDTPLANRLAEFADTLVPGDAITVTSPGRSAHTQHAVAVVVRANTVWFHDAAGRYVSARREHCTAEAKRWPG